MQTGEILTMKRHIIFIIVGLIFCLFCSKQQTTDRPGSNTTGENTPMIWCGAEQRIRTNETVTRYINYPIVIRALDDNGNFKNNETIRFEIVEMPGGANAAITSVLITSTIQDNQFFVGGYPGTAHNETFITNQTGFYQVKITHETVSGGKSKTLNLYVIDDAEESGLAVPFSHEKYGVIELKGDGFDDNIEIGEDKTKKNVFVELDYINSMESRIQDIISIAETILNTGGMKVSIIKDEALFIGSGNKQLPDVFTTRKEMKTILKDTRQMREHIHAILATAHSNSNLYGITMQYYGDVGENWTHADCARGATGFSDNDPAYFIHYKDSTGCMVFTANIDNHHAGGTWTNNNAVAWTLAHELGHALGLSNHNLSGKSIMSEAPFTNITNPFGEYDQFGAFELTPTDNIFGINTRDILGRDNIDIAW